jgi:hypothetical protein
MAKKKTLAEIDQEIVEVAAAYKEAQRQVEYARLRQGDYDETVDVLQQRINERNALQERYKKLKKKQRDMRARAGLPAWGADD